MSRELSRKRRNIIVIGGSAGSLEPLRRILTDLTPDLDAAIFITQHMGSRHATKLHEILGTDSGLPVLPAEDGGRICEGEVRIAQPDQHLVLDSETVHLTRGPRENQARPAIDPLFRTAAAHHQARVIAVLLSGYLSDGVAGLSAVQKCGGLTIVQDPDAALVRDMPQNALHHVAPDFTGDAGRIAELLNQLAGQHTADPGPVPETILAEARMALGRGLSIPAEDRMGKRSPFACPSCNGNLWEIDDEILRYRCHVGHAYTADALSEAQAGRLDEALWAALRGLRERTELLRRLAREGREAGRGSSVQGFETSAHEIEAQAAVLENFILTRAREQD
ncbi:chemotaxis protein CheB [Sulfitobacter aestuarii]|uniref:protein-glutamate methylesterase n=1 Tax=Sulfitobacter aestuarii TaxID=2161676 RepID=A0ABW5U439_9RHOB